MRIINITLENYRIHDKLFVEFEKGINLLLGSNGKGKSSILEAIGITLFSSSFRDGNTKGQQQCIKYGKKEALIVIEFVGNDNETYIIENQIKKSGGYNKLYNKNFPNEILSSKDEILNKLSTLVGIDGEVKDIYENIIVAKQNEFINSFKLKATERQKVFDRIFNTDIYRDIYEGLSKKSYDNYVNSLNKESSFIEGIEKNLEDYTLLLSQHTEKEKELVALNDSIELYSKELKTIENSLENHRTLEKRILSEKRELEKSKEIIFIKKEEHVKLTEKLEKSKLSEKILKDNLEFYNKYIDLRNEYRIKNEELEILSKKVEYYISQQLLQKETSNQIERINSQIRNIETNAFNIDENLKIQTEEKNNIQNELLSKENDKITLEKTIKKLIQEISQFDTLKSSYDILQNQIEIKKVFLENTRQNLMAIELDLRKIDINEFHSKLKTLNKEQENKNELILQINTLDTRIKDNNHAKIELSSSICPYLKEKCLNLHDRDTADFFSNKEQFLLNEKTQILDEISQYSNLESHIKHIEQEINTHEKTKKNFEDEKNKYSEDSLKFQLLEKDLELESIKLSAFSKEIGTGEDLNRLLTENKVKLDNLFIENLKEKHTLISKKISEGEKNKNELLNLKEKEIKGLKALEETLKEISTYLNNSQDIQKAYETEKEKLREIDLKSSTYHSNYEIYIKNEPLAKEITDILKSIDLIEKEIYLLIEKEKSSSETLVSLENEKNSYTPFEELMQKSSSYKSKLEEAYLLLGTIKSALLTLENRMEVAKNTEKLIRDKKAIINKLQDKMKLTEIFRKNIKDMGIRVSQTLLLELSFWATENFRKITGRNETISWSNEDNPYEVCLLGDKKVSFEQLSGGEQVAVAISIRGAMTTTFTKTNFSIFDEPTNNLDLERRKSLADNIGEILSNLEQSIIVTHDDSFREMAQKVIEL